MTLFEECIEALQPSVKILPLSQRLLYSRLISDNFPMQLNGSINWLQVNQKIRISDSNKIFSYLEQKLNIPEKEAFILWDGAHLPVMQADIVRIIHSIDDVTAVGFDTWIILPKNKLVIEFYHEGDITIGYY